LLNYLQNFFYYVYIERGNINPDALLFLFYTIFSHWIN